MLLVIDVGNTNTVIGVFEDDKLVLNWRISTDRNKTVDEYGLLLSQLMIENNIEKYDIKDIIMSSVVPHMTDTLPQTFSKYFCKKPIQIGPGIKTGMNIIYDNPREVGADRIVNGVGAYSKYKGPSIVIDLGTAVSIDVIDGQGNYIGGAIAPGIQISSDALFARASKLPRVELQKPDNVTGKNTIEGIQSGIYYGFTGMIDRLIEEIAKDMEEDLEDINIIATGGFSELIMRDSKYIKILDPTLTLDGLKVIYDRNK